MKQHGSSSHVQQRQWQQQGGCCRMEGPRLSATLALGLLVSCSSNTGRGAHAFVMPVSSRGLVVHRHHQVQPWRRSGGVMARRSVGRVCASLGDSGDDATAASKKAFDDVLKKGSTEECLKVLRQSGGKLDLGMTEASKLLNIMAGEIKRDLKEDKLKDDALTNTYNALKTAGLLRGFGSIDFAKVPSKSRDVSAERLLSLSGVEKQNLAPGRPTGSWLSAGVGVFGAEYLAGRLMGLDPLQTVIPWTLGLIFADRLFLNGAVAESLTRLIVPGYRERIIKHEAGHFLVAYLLGCPVQGCLLDPFVLGSGVSGAQGGTVFADPILSKQMAQGKLTKSSIDRFSIVLMGGIAAEAMNYGSSEGGSADEGVMIGILSTIAPPFNREQIKAQALWAATQAVLLIQEHKEAYEVLVLALENGAELGECVQAIETELAKRELPGDVRRADREPGSPADEMRQMLVRRMSQRNRSEQERMIREGSQEAKEAPTAATIQLRKELAEEDTAMLELQRRVEDLERTLESGTSIGAMGLKEDSGGVWVNDLKSLREDIAASRASKEDNKTAAALDAVLSDEPSTAATSSEPSASTTTTAAAAAAATTPTLPSLAGADAPTSEEPLTLVSSPEMRREDVFREIDEKTAENAKRMAEVEERLRKFEEKQRQR
ncbi:unnamed protein product [Pylaiella littoralis]